MALSESQQASHGVLQESPGSLSHVVTLGSITKEPRDGNAGEVYATRPGYAVNALGMPNRGGDRLRWQQAAQEMAAEEKQALAIERHARQAALLARVARDARYADGMNPVQHLSDLISTTERAGEGRALSAEAQQKGAREAYLGAMVSGWQEAGVLPWLRKITPETEADLAREMARLNGAPGIPATPDASLRAAAEAAVAMQALIRRDANEAGAWVQPLPGRVTRTTHSGNRLRQAGFEGWRNTIAPLLDERTFTDAGIDLTDGAAANRFLENVYGNLVSGNHHVAGRGDVDPLARGYGSGSLARRLSEDRVLHFRGADEWLAYNRAFGDGNLVSALVGEAESAARSVGMMRIWGPNPETAFQQDVQRLADRLRDGEKRYDDVRKLQEAASGGFLAKQWATISGAADIPGSTSAARFTATFRALETITSLGGVTLSSLPDLATTASALRHEGVPYFKALTNQVMALLPGYDNDVRRQVSTRALAGLNGLLGGLHHRMGYDAGVPGSITRATDIFFKLNLQTWWQDAQERGVSSLIASHVGESLGQGWDAMDQGLRRSLQRYGVTAEDWTAMQGAELLRDGSGIAYFTPDMIDGPARQRIGAWFASTIDGALTKPGVYERSILYQGQAPGTVAGEALRFIGQFKSYPLTFVTRHLSREMYRQGSADFAGLAGLIAGTTLLGYVSMTLKELAAGKNPREPEDTAGWAKLVMAALQQGGGAGIYGDYLFGDANRFGGGLLATMAGPTAGTAEKVYGIMTRLRDRATGDDKGNLAAQAISFAARDLLPTNIFYSKLLLDHLVIYRLQEAVDPGYLRRLERRVERENDQTFWKPPTDAVR